MAAFTVTFLLSSRREGSERSHRTVTARLLDAPAGRAVVVTIGLAVIGFYLAQLVRALTRGFESELDVQRMPRAVRVVTAIAGTTGISGRVLAFLPVGVFLVIAGLTHDPNKAKGLDATLRDAAGSWWGLLLLIAVTVGFTAFAVYTFLEAAYRKVQRA
jgi:hypothetical protein